VPLPEWRLVSSYDVGNRYILLARRTGGEYIVREQRMTHFVVSDSDTLRSQCVHAAVRLFHKGSTPEIFQDFR
jgi:hypothetical protein